VSDSLAAPGEQTRGSGTLLNALNFWGVWPATVMALAQWEAARLSQSPYPRAVLLVTLAGTLGIYGLDRWVERSRRFVTGARHHGHPLSFAAFASLILLFLGLALPDLNGHLWWWLLCLLALGLIYLAVTAAYLRLFPIGKELVGSLCFSVLVWGWRDSVLWLPLLAFFLLGLANFLISSHQDRARDRENHIRSLALIAPSLNSATFRGCALVACLLFILSSGPTSPLPWIALAHGLWPTGRRHAIDWAFLTLLLRPLAALFGVG